MATLEQTFTEVYDLVALFLGWGASPSAGNVTKAKNIVYRGYRRFLQPINMRRGTPHVWSFLEQHGTIITIANKWQYDLPIDYGYMTRKFEFDSQRGLPPMEERSVSQVMEARVMTTATSYPRIFAIRNAKYVKTIGTLKEVIFHPVPGSVRQFNYSYVMSPPKPVDDGDFFVGGAWASEAIMECCLAAAELQEDDIIGVHEQKAQEILQQLIQTDLMNAPKTCGRVYDTGLIRVDRRFHRYLANITDDEVYAN